MSYFVRAYDIKRINLEPDKVEEILQNIAVILSTPQQSVPLERGLGLSMDFLDKPISVAKAMMVAEINEAIVTQEPRATVVDISFEIDDTVPGKLIPTVEVDIADEWKSEN